MPRLLPASANRKEPQHVGRPVQQTGRALPSENRDKPGAGLGSFVGSPSRLLSGIQPANSSLMPRLPRELSLSKAPTMVNRARTQAKAEGTTTQKSS